MGLDSVLMMRSAYGFRFYRQRRAVPVVIADVEGEIQSTGSTLVIAALARLAKSCVARQGSFPSRIAAGRKAGHERCARFPCGRLPPRVRAKSSSGSPGRRFQFTRERRVVLYGASSPKVVSRAVACNGRLRVLWSKSEWLMETDPLAGWKAREVGRGPTTLGARYRDVELRNLCGTVARPYIPPL